MVKVKEKEFNIEREWNDFIWSLIQAERAWKKLSDYSLKTVNVDDMPEKLPQAAFRVCRTTKFRYAIEDIVRLCGVRGSVKDYLIKTKKIGD